MTASPSRERHIKWLKWAIWFSQVDLSDFRDGDWINLRQDLKDYVGSRFGAAIAGVITIPQEFIEELVSSLGTKEKQGELKTLQSGIKQDLKSLAYYGEDESIELLPVKSS